MEEDGTADLKKSHVRYVPLVESDEDSSDFDRTRDGSTETSSFSSFSSSVSASSSTRTQHEQRFKDLERKQQSLYAPGWRGHLSRLRGRLRVMLDSLVWQLLIIVLILIDLIFAIVDIAVDSDAALYTALAVSCAIIAILILEALARLFAWGPKAYIRDWFNWFDILIIIISIIILIIFWTVGSFSIWGRLVTASIRFLRIIFNIYKQRKRLQVAARHIVGENKQRFQEDGFDLDLAYITPRVIVMSVPAIKLEALYRNNIDEVARFFKKRHYGHFKIFNICEERDYSAYYYKFDNQVIRYPVADHNVPTLGLMLAFCEYVEQWMNSDEENIIAVHCRGGKGRSGTMICAWLIYSGICKSAEDALDLFGAKRTDWSKGSKFQGVETQSQCRYIGYFEWVINNNKRLPSVVPRTSLTKIIVEVSPSLQLLARKFGWRKKDRNSAMPVSSLWGDSSMDSLSASSSTSSSSKGSSWLSAFSKKRRNFNDGIDDDLDVEDNVDLQSQASGMDLEWGQIEDAGEEAKWRIRVTHTDGEKLAVPMVLYPSWINEEFIIFERELEPVPDSPDGEGREKEIILKGDTRMELLGLDERSQRERIFLYFWIHTSFMTDSSNSSRATTPRTRNNLASQGNNGTSTYNGQASGRTTSSHPSLVDEEETELVPMDDISVEEDSVERSREHRTEEQVENKEMVMELDRDDVDRGRYKGCPFKKTERVFVRLHYHHL